ncbi:condensation domain-containing protein [Nostoc sp. ChiQUE01b]|uniref:condensation domain-containing protein n=1 Tax=Nostoc sp. ChiQUE01b TaxID=3075376 RepID=UPI002AD50AC3|nr:condensation domain-containing protein [Nostoc sp. ChiQUE01b]MDZ8262378.1 condensation domain-containing protein [Nostoc sp. ChiQUE01b]
MSDLSQRIANLSPKKRELFLQRLNKNERDIFSQEQIKFQSRKSNCFPLSFPQQRLWLLEQLYPGSFTYNEPAALRFVGDLNIAALEQSFVEIVRRHEVFRTTFPTVDGQPVQAIAPTGSIKLPMVNLRDLPKVEQEALVQQLAQQEAQLPFDLTRESLLRVTLLHLGEKDNVVLVTTHHIVSDGWSMGVFVRELAALYEAFCAGKPSPLPKLPIQYADFCVWQRHWLQGEVLEEKLTYWKRQLSTNLPVLQLPTVRPRETVITNQGATNSFVIPCNLSKNIQVLSRQEDVTLFMTLLAAFQILLQRYTNQDDIVVGTDVANRNQPETELLIGFFINLLVLRTYLGGNPTFRELLKQVRKITLEAYDHQDLPFEKLVEVLAPARNSSHTPLFQVLFVLQNTQRLVLEFPGLTLSQFVWGNNTARFDLSLFLTEIEQGIKGNWRYNSDLFDATTITRMSGHFEALLNSIVAQPDTRINNLEMLTEAEKREKMETEVKQEKSKLKNFKNFKPKAVKLPQGQLIKIDYLRPGETLPLVLKPELNDFDLIDWVQSNREFIETELLKHGAILLRGFNLDSVSTFENLAQAICPSLFGEYGDLPRVGISNKVYGSTPYPPDQAILFHNESSHMHCWPLKIWFFCIQPAKLGGETPIVDCRKVYQLLDPKLRARFEQKQLMYIRNYTEGLDVSWQDFFHTTDKTVVENYCCQAGIDFEWLSGNGLVTRKVRPAVSKHPKTGELVFFNQVQLHHISCLESSIRESLLLMFGEEKLPRNVYYGDGSAIEDSVMKEIGTVYQQATISFPWQKGDVLMLDNMLTAHGRNPYEGSRKILVAMGEMIRSEDI